MSNACGFYPFVIDVCSTVVTMYEGGIEDVDGVFGKTLCIKLQDKNLHDYWYVSFEGNCFAFLCTLLTKA